MLPDELIASILVYVPSRDLLRYLKFFNKSFGRIIDKYGKLFTIDLARSNINDTDLCHLKGVGGSLFHTINLSHCHRITNTGLEHLRGVHTINLYKCTKITDAGLAHLKGVHTVNLSWCAQITDAGLVHLKGVHTINLSNCVEITDAGLASIKGWVFQP